MYMDEFDREFRDRDGNPIGQEATTLLASAEAEDPSGAEEDLNAEDLEEDGDEEEDDGTAVTVKITATITAPPGMSMSDIEVTIRGALADEGCEVDGLETEQVASSS